MIEAAASVHDPQRMRAAGRDLLSLALIDARNRTLRWLAAFEGAPAPEATHDVDPAPWLVGHAAWFQEYWIGRHLQRQRGAAGGGGASRLASLDPRADDWFDPARSRRAQRWAEAARWPAAEDLRAYLAATLDTTLELLDGADETDEGLYVYRLALRQEDEQAERLAELAQACSLPAARLGALWPEQPARTQREPLWFPGQRVVLGAGLLALGRVPDNETGQLDEALPEFEIDAQPVNWRQFGEFVADGGYDEARWWSPEGWAWLQAEGRRVPRYVEQAGGGGVLALRQGRLQRLAAGQAVLHVNRHEAQAWCAWAGRRLPTEPEWAHACAVGGSRGWVWGDAFEWVAGRARLFPGATPGPAALGLPDGADGGLLRGASFLTVPRLKHREARRFAAVTADAPLAGFRSCAL